LREAGAHSTLSSAAHSAVVSSHVTRRARAGALT